MKLPLRLLVPLLIIIFLLTIPPSAIVAFFAYLYNVSGVSQPVHFIAVYRLPIAALLIVAVMLFSMAKEYLGTCRSIYTASGAVFILLAFPGVAASIHVPSWILIAAAAVALAALFVVLVSRPVHRVVFLSMSAAVIALDVLYPPYLVAIAGAVISASSFFVSPSTRALHIYEVNLKPQPSPPPTPVKKTAPSPAPSPAAAKPAQQPKAAPPPSSPPKSQTAVQNTKREAKQIFSFHRSREDEFPPNISWPAQSDYARSMQNLDFCISSRYPELKGSRVVPNPYLKLPGSVAYSSGNYGIIFKLVNGGSAIALKCFTRGSRDLNSRYRAISAALSPLDRSKLPFVEFQYLPQAVRTLKNPSVYLPALKMEWIEGKNLNTYIGEMLRKKETLEGLASAFLDQMARLRKYSIAHGDISGDNIIVDGSGRPVLVDYDGMYVPAFRGMESPELGHDHFQHPGRNNRTYGERLDNFSILVTYLSILAVASNPSLWAKYNRGEQDCLIFRKQDYLNPGNSPVIKGLLSTNGKVRDLTSLLVDALKHDPLWSGTDPQQIAKI